MSSHLSSYRKEIVIILLGLALNAGLLYLYYRPAAKHLVGDEVYYVRLAAALARGESVEHNLLWPPLYADWMGAVFSLLGVKRISIQALQIALWLVSALLFYRIVQRLFRPVASYALCVFLLSPELTAFSHYFWPETIHLFFWIAGLWLLICHAEKLPAFAAAGVAFGLALLTKLLLMPFLPVLLAFVWWTRSDSVRRRTRAINVGVMTGALLLTILPTMVSNRQRYGTFMIADSSAFNLWVGLNDAETVDSRGDVATEFARFQQSGPDLQTRNAVYREKIVRKVREQGVLNTFTNQVSKQYFRLFDYQSFFATQLAGGGREAYTFTAPLLVHSLKLYSWLMYSFVLLTGAIGMCFVQTKAVSWPQCFLSFIVYNLALFLFLHVKTRYVIQLLPIFMFFSGTVLYGLYTHFARRSSPQADGFVFTRGRIVLSVATGLLMGVMMFRSVLIKI